MTTAQLLLNLLVGGLLPLVVAVVTHQRANSSVKALVLLLLSVVGGVLTQHLNDARTDWKPVALAIASQFVAAVSSHFGLTKPLRVTGSTGVLQAVLPHGIGAPAAPPAPPASPGSGA